MNHEETTQMTQEEIEQVNRMIERGVLVQDGNGGLKFRDEYDDGYGDSLNYRTGDETEDKDLRRVWFDANGSGIVVRRSDLPQFCAMISGVIRHLTGEENIGDFATAGNIFGGIEFDFSEAGEVSITERNILSLLSDRDTPPTKRTLAEDAYTGLLVKMLENVS